MNLDSCCEPELCRQPPEANCIEALAQVGFPCINSRCLVGRGHQLLRERKDSPPQVSGGGGLGYPRLPRAVSTLTRSYLVTRGNTQFLEPGNASALPATATRWAIATGVPLSLVSLMSPSLIGYLSLVMRHTPLGTYSRPRPRALRWSWGGGATASYERGTPSMARRETLWCVS